MLQLILLFQDRGALTIVAATAGCGAGPVGTIGSTRSRRRSGRGGGGGGVCGG